MPAAPSVGGSGTLTALEPDLPSVSSGLDRAASTTELRLASVLFVDLVGFTSLSEVRDAEDVRELLGRYFDTARTIVERHGGVVEKFIGDAVMAVWGVPAAREDDAERAVRAALEVVDAVGVLGEDVGTARLPARAGVVSGQVAVVEKPGEGLVVGDRVNTASRVQSAAQPGSVLVDDVTRQLTSAAIAFEDAGQHVVKGKTERLRLWRAVRVIAGIGGSEREAGLEAPFVGRDGDLWLIKELFHGALERRSARLVAVSGEAGVGKSRVRREFFMYVDGLSQRVLWHLGRCPSFGDGVAYRALVQMVRQRFAITEEATTEEASAKLGEGLERWIADPADREFLRPRLGVLLGVADPGLAREELFSGWRLFFERLAERLPVVLVLEDVQWADAGLLDFIEELLDWSASSPIFILALARPQLATGRDGWPAGRRGATTVQLEPLGEPAMRELLAGLVNLPDRAAGRIVERAQGVPLYAIETVRALADRGALSERNGRLVLEGELGELDVPPSLSSLLAARLDALEPVERALVKAMSVFGGAFPRSAASVLGDVPGAELDGVLGALVRRQVFVIRADRLSPDRGRYAFAQGLLRAVAYEMLSRQERKLRHLAAAKHLRRAFPNDGEDVAQEIASHYLGAYRAAGQDRDAPELRGEALVALRRAARRAATVGAPEAAERAYLAAAELAEREAERTALTQAAGGMALQSGRSEHALELFEAAVSAHLAAGRERDAARTTGDVGRALNRLRRPQEAIERLGAALATLAGDQFDPDVAKLNVDLGNALVRVGDYERAGPPVQTALQIAEALDLPAVLCDALNLEAMVSMFTGRVRQARVLCAGALEIAQSHELTRQLAIAQGNMGNLGVLWDLPDAEEHIQRAVALARRRGDRRLESLNSGNLMILWLLVGRWSQVQELAGELLADDEQRPGAEHLHCRLAILHALRGDPGAAQASLERLSAWEITDEREARANHAATRIGVLLAQGRVGDALELGQRMLPHAIETLGAAHESVRQAWPDALQAALALGRVRDAEALLALLARRPLGHVPPYMRAQIDRYRALIDAAEHRGDAVEADLAAAIDALQQLGYPYARAVAQVDLAAWLTVAGRAGDAALLRKQATATLESLGAGTGLGVAIAGEH